MIIVNDSKFSFFKFSFLCTVFLAILQITNVIDINIWFILLPLLLGVAEVFVIFFLIGLLTTYFIYSKDIDLDEIKKMVETHKKDSEDENDS